SNTMRSSNWLPSTRNSWQSSNPPLWNPWPRKKNKLWLILQHRRGRHNGPGSFPDNMSAMQQQRISSYGHTLALPSISATDSSVSFHIYVTIHQNTEHLVDMLLRG